MKICLTMIVKNEAHVIERCLRSVLPVIDCYAIVDTGSTDDTIAIMERVLEGKRGVIAQKAWTNFADARNTALNIARSQIGVDYFLMMDADHVWHGEIGAEGADAYYVEHRYAGAHYGLACLLRESVPWFYKGVVHEYVTSIAPHLIVDLPGPWVEVFHDGVRSRDAKTYDKDAVLLEEALRADPHDARNQFYYAQSLKDALRLAEAFEAYRKRTMMAGWDEETWFARLEMARLAERLSHPPEEVQRLYLVAYNARPTRAETLCDLARWHRLNGEFALANLFASYATSLEKPADRLFIDESCYTWRPFDELVIVCWYLGDIDRGRIMADHLRALDYPADQAARIEANCKFYDREDSAVA